MDVHIWKTSGSTSDARTDGSFEKTMKLPFRTADRDASRKPLSAPMTMKGERRGGGEVARCADA